MNRADSSAAQLTRSADIATDTQPTHLLDIDPATFQSHYNRDPFIFHHKLAEHPLMQLDALVELANRLPPDQVRYCRGKTSLATNFDQALRERRHTLSVQHLLKDVQNSDGYVLLFQANSDPAYDRLFDDVLDDLKPLVDPVDPGMIWRAADIFIASPGAITPYHLDREMNFLCQVRGTKLVQLWDQNDRSILSQREIERVCARPTEPKPGYKPDYAAKARKFTLGPGLGVHQPLMAPHAVQNGDEVSIAIAFTYRTQASQHQAMVNAFNYRLRKFGLSPSEFGRRPWLDGAKDRLFNAYLRARSLELG